ncbi:MAG TPA: hypothetical protein ENJ84_15600 [Gammaproteobacteria bacterium]|nr:hypothetical protein [Gammaproteobacteria bacterium]
MNKLWPLAVIALLTGCSNKAIYENIQLNNRNDCIKLPQSQYEDCVRSANKSYEEYEQERQK